MLPRSRIGYTNEQVPWQPRDLPWSMPRPKEGDP